MPTESKMIMSSGGEYVHECGKASYKIEQPG